MNKTVRQWLPWTWIPTLYVAEAIPYVAVNTLTVLMYTKLGVGLKEMAFFTGWLYLPWVIKPFWSPFVDLIGSKRGWVLAMQLLIGLGLGAVAFLLPGSAFFASTLAVFWLIAFFSATHDIAADGYYMLELNEHEQAKFVGIRSTFYRIGTLLGQGGMVWFAGKIEEAVPGHGGILQSWMWVFGFLSLFFLSVAVYHLVKLPRAVTDRPRRDTGFGDIIRGFGSAFVTFFRKPHIVSALCFMLFYRFPEAMCMKIVQPFLVGDRSMGALGMTTAQVGVGFGIWGVVALLAGGILGGIAISRDGLKRWLWPMALCLTLPCAFYCILALWQPDPADLGQLICIDAAIFVEQFGYGFGFTAFMLYLIYFSEGPLKTSHYAFCTAFMALGMMLPGMASGWIFEQLNLFNPYSTAVQPGYINFFFWIMLSCFATFIVCMKVHISPSFGKKRTKNE